MKTKVCLFLIIISYFLTSCKRDNFSINNPKIYNTTLYKIEYFKHIEGEAFAVEENPTFAIIDKEELEKAIKEIRNADNSEPRKGAGWNKVKLYFMDEVMVLNTSNEKIGTKASGDFYDLPNNNFIKRNLK
ncbi:hypothetical protein [Flavobacterium sp.]|uniref:hypothetical protein n=1 Tax=Flavobacterium sp. TaxID=239 RepID=UPI003751CADB